MLAVQWGNLTPLGAWLVANRPHLKRGDVRGFDGGWRLVAFGWWLLAFHVRADYWAHPFRLSGWDCKVVVLTRAVWRWRRHLGR